MLPSFACIFVVFSLKHKVHMSVKEILKEQMQIIHDHDDQWIVTSKVECQIPIYPG